MSDSKKININVPVLTRVEGEGALELEINNGVIEKLQLKIFEPPRLFEKFIEGYQYDQVIDMVARICGICPVAYQITAAQAFEDLFKTETSPWVKRMRRVMYCGEWIQSHALHIHLLAAPDFFGFDSAIAMAQDFPNEVNRGLKLQGIGNDLISLFGGRSVHPVGIKAGGFYKAPSKTDISLMHDRLTQALIDAEAIIHWVAQIDIPDDNQDFISIALHHPDEYAIGKGTLISSKGHNINIKDFEQHIKENQAPHSTALHAMLDGQAYLTGPLARMNLNHQLLPEKIQKLMAELNIQFPSKNMFHSMIARAIELYFVIDESIHLLENYDTPELSDTTIDSKSGIAIGCTEAPRGILWHRYEVDSKGLIQHAKIVPPTSQNQTRMEIDIQQSLENMGLENNDVDLKLRAEKVIRNYDPCISCATHFLKLKINR